MCICLKLHTKKQKDVFHSYKKQWSQSETYDTETSFYNGIYRANIYYL